MTGTLHRRSLRLPEYDYSQIGTYFVTICVHRRERLLGSIRNVEMQLNEYGQIVAECWQWLPGAYPYVCLDEWVIMPNHLHGIIVINGRGGSRTAPIKEFKAKPLGRLIGAFKTVSTKKINAFRQIKGAAFWQRNFFEHVVRNEESLNRIREYIITNPQRWDLDRENPRAVGKDKFDSWLAGFKSIHSDQEKIQ